MSVNITPQEIKARPVKDPKKDLKWQRDRDRQIVKGIFRFYEVPGGSLRFCYKEYREDEVESFDMVDGQVYSVPLGVARHLNKRGSYPNYVYTQDEYGLGKVKVSTQTHRFGFQSLEFIDDEDVMGMTKPSIITVEKVL